MERTDEYRKALDVPISELSIDRIIEEIRRQPENFEALYHLTTDEKLLVSWRALWVCDKLCRQYPDWFAPLREELTGGFCVYNILRKSGNTKGNRPGG